MQWDCGVDRVLKQDLLLDWLLLLLDWLLLLLDC